MANNNKKKGTEFENDFATFLSNRGYWVSLFPGKEYSGSQPADMIACKDGNVWLIDCKTLENKNGLFPLDRIEENQRLSYKKFIECKNFNYFLSILWKNNIYFINLWEIDFFQKSLDLKEYFPIFKNFKEVEDE